MKKLLLPFIILGTGVVIFGHCAQLARKACASTLRSDAEWLALSNKAEQLTVEKAALGHEIEASKGRLSGSSGSAPLSPELLGWLQSGQSNRCPQSVLPELCRRLGLTWNSSPEYVLVSKASLKGLSLNGASSQGGLTPAVCDVLALTAGERARLEELMERTQAEYLGWMKTNVQRMEPSGDIVARYVVPANPKLSQRLVLEGGLGVLGVVGGERTELCRNFAWQWVEEHAFLGQAAVTLTVSRSSEGGQAHLQARFDTILWGGVRSKPNLELTPSTFPGVFRAIFPDGWRELAQREDFELPDGFQDAPAAR